MMTSTPEPITRRPRSSTLVGRDRELGVLREGLGAALAGRGGMVLLSGAAGIGKTALAEALCAEAAGVGALVLIGRCYDRAETPPYGPFLDLLHGYEPVDGLPPAPFSPWLGPVAVGSQAALYERVLRFFQEIAVRRPLVLLLDDLQWADQASLDLLRVIARAIRGWPVLVIATYRADELPRRHPLATLLPLLEHDAPVTSLSLRALNHDALAALARGRYPLPAEDAARLAAYLTARSEGNPLFAVQLLSGLEEQGTLRRAEPAWTLGDLDGLGVPLPLLRVIDLRLARLSDGTRALLDLAALLGQEIPLRLWASVAEVEEAEVEDAVEEAGAIGVLEAGADGARACFVHALVREAIYAGVFPPRRRALHRRIAEVLATVPAVDPDAPAYHFAQAGDPRAIAWLRRAAERAEQLFALRTAAERLTAALALVREHEAPAAERGWLLLRLAWLQRYGHHQQGLAALDEAEQVALAVGDRALAAQAVFQRGYLQCQQGQLREGLAALEAGVAALDALSPEERERERALASAAGADRARHDARAARETLALFLAVAGRYAEAQVMAEPHAATAPGLPVDGTAEQARAIAHGACGRPTEARQAYARARAAYEAAGHQMLAASMGMQELRYIVLPYQTEALAEGQELAGQASEALRQAGGMSTTWDLPIRLPLLPLLALEGKWGEARELATTRIPGPWRGLCSGVLAMLAHGQGDVDLAWATVHAALPAGPTTEPGDYDCREALPLQRLAATLALEADDLPAAHAWLAAHDRWLGWSGAVLGRAEATLGWAAYYRSAGDLALARRQAEAALAHASDPRQPLALIATHRFLGELGAEEGRFTAAERHLAEALALADACAVPYERGLTLLVLTDRRRDAGDHDIARRLGQEARAIGAALGASPMVMRAEAVLAASTDEPEEITFPAGLSAREIEILRHVAAGRANREIAVELSLSEHTVRAHVRHIFAKTGAENRAAATAFAFRHHLT